MISFEVKYTSANKVNDLLNGLSEAFSPSVQKSMLRKIGILYLADTEGRFDISRQHNPDRKKWEKLKPSTLRLKEKGFKGRGPSISAPEHRGVWTSNLSSTLQMRFEGDSVLIGSDQEYAKTFHYGRKKKARGTAKNGKTLYSPWGDIPARRFLGRNTRIDSKVMNVLEQEIIKQTGINPSSIKSAV
jgi:phage gpG-like protein